MSFFGDNGVDSDVFEQLIKKMGKVKDISPGKLGFETIENIVVISMKNYLKDGIDLDCFLILNQIYQVIAPLGIKFYQQLYL